MNKEAMQRTLFSTLNDSQLYVPALVTAFLLLITPLLFFLYRCLRAKSDTVLFVGLAGSGKSTMFTKLINPENQWISYMSVKENKFTENRVGRKPIKLLDYPGSESFRKILFQKRLAQERNALRCVVFAVDSAAFNKKDVAEFLYDVLFELKSSKIPVLIACNKQDIGHAKSGQLIQKSIEQEFGLINVSREAALSSTDGKAEKRLLTNTGRDFKWSDMQKGTRLDFIECSAVERPEEEQEFSLEPVRVWIEKI